MEELDGLGDCWKHICTFLGLDDMKSLGLVSKYLSISTKDENLWKELIERDFPTLIEESKNSNKFFETYRKEVNLRLKKHDRLLRLTESHNEYGFKNIKMHVVGCAFRGEIDELQRALSEFTNTALAFQKAAYQHWVYYGNFSSTYPAVIYRTNDESLNRYEDDDDDDDDEGDHNGEYKEKKDGTKRKRIVEYDFYYPTEGQRYDEDEEDDDERKGNLFHWACLGGHVDCVKFLLDNYSNYFDIDDVITQYGATGLDIARTNSYWDVVKLILEYKKKKNHHNK
eukprot:TRINITY_DN1957_c4_g1_i1.p1 TRINITY_DN1957_c4_g1~~TRINITY_DN1957_c4_g1_i1.p1  ORF type:complete len:283 (-),score=70.36 TRINITY_DN1957_c4_g1_i1:173-1021(-)